VSDAPSPPSATLSSAATSKWFEEFSGDFTDQLPQSRTAFFYRPDADAFFRGEDPLALVARIPDLVVVALALQEDTLLEDIDPFSCVVQATGLTRAPPSELKEIFDNVAGLVEFVELNDTSQGRISPPARSVLEAQILLLEETGIEGNAGRLAAAGSVAANVLRHLGLVAAASDLQAAAERSVANGDASSLVTEIRAVLDDAPPAGVP